MPLLVKSPCSSHAFPVPATFKDNPRQPAKGHAANEHLHDTCFPGPKVERLMSGQVMGLEMGCSTPHNICSSRIPENSTLVLELIMFRLFSVVFIWILNSSAENGGSCLERNDQYPNECCSPQANGCTREMLPLGKLNEQINHTAARCYLTHDQNRSLLVLILPFTQEWMPTNIAFCNNLCTLWLFNMAMGNGP